MDLVGVSSMKITFARPIFPKPGSPAVAIRGLEARGLAEAILKIVEQGKKPSGSGPYSPDERGVVARFAEFSTGRSALETGGMASLLIRTKDQRPDLPDGAIPFDVDINPCHIHRSSDPMTASTFVLHSLTESNDRLVASEPEELAVLLTAILRQRQLKAFLSETTTTIGETVSSYAGVCVLLSNDAPLINFAVGVTTHPIAETLAVFGDDEVDRVLSALALLNAAKANDGTVEDTRIISAILGLNNHSLVERLLAHTAQNTCDHHPFAKD